MLSPEYHVTFFFLNHTEKAACMLWDTQFMKNNYRLKYYVYDNKCSDVLQFCNEPQLGVKIKELQPLI